MIDLLELAEVQAEVQCPSPRLTYLDFPPSGEARPVFRRRADGRRLRGARLQGLPPLHLQIRAGNVHASYCGIFCTL